MSEQTHQAFAHQYVMIACAPNGARRTHRDHASLPMTPTEIAEQAARLPDAGVSLLHLHVRDANGQHSLSPDLYRQATVAIRQEVGAELVIQITTEAVGRYSPEEQMAVVRALRPEAVSLALAELCPDESSEAQAGQFFESLQSNGTWPQYILYTPGQLRRFQQLRKKGFFGEDDPSCLLVLGNYVQKTDGDLTQLTAMLEVMDSEIPAWSACCFGQSEHEVLLSAVDQGGHVRLGFENNLWLPDGSLAADNVQLIRHFSDALGGDRSPASADQLREVFLQP